MVSVEAPWRISILGQLTLGNDVPVAACTDFAEDPAKNRAMPHEDEADVSAAGAAGPPPPPIEQPPANSASENSAPTQARSLAWSHRRIHAFPGIPPQLIAPLSTMPLLYQAKHGHPKALRRDG